MTKKELQQKTVSELRKLAAKLGISLGSRVKAGIVDEMQKGMRRAVAKKKASAKKKTKKAAASGAKKTVKKAADAKKKAPAEKKTGKAAVSGAKKTVKKAAPAKKKAPAEKKTMKSAITGAKKTVKKAAPAKKKAPTEKKTRKAEVSGAKKTVKKAAPAKKKAPAEKKTRKAAVSGTKKTVKKAAPAKKKAPAEKKTMKAAIPGTKKTVKKTVSAGKKAPPSAAAEKPEIPRAKGTAPAGKPSFGKRKSLPAARTSLPKSGKPSLPRRASAVETPRKRPYTVTTTPPSWPGEGAAVPVREDKLTAIVVDPWQMFVYWELTDKTRRKGAPALRVHDVEAGVDFTGENALRSFDVSISGSSGNLYLDLLPGREYYIDLGYTGVGGFVTVRRVGRLSTPPHAPAEGESVLPAEYFMFKPGGGASS